MAVTYTTAALVKKRLEHIDSTLLDGDIEQYIYEAEGTINSAMKYSLIADFDATGHTILRSCATSIAAREPSMFDDASWLMSQPAVAGKLVEHLDLFLERR